MLNEIFKEVYLLLIYIDHPLTAEYREVLCFCSEDEVFKYLERQYEERNWSAVTIAELMDGVKGKGESRMGVFEYQIEISLYHGSNVYDLSDIMNEVTVRPEYYEDEDEDEYEYDDEYDDEDEDEDDGIGAGDLLLKAKTVDEIRRVICIYEDLFQSCW